MSLDIVFMGTPDFAKTSLEFICKEGYKLKAVVTQPDKQKNRGMKISCPPVKEFALENNIEVFQPEKIKDESFINLLKALAPDVIVVVAYGKILPKEVLEIPKFGCINVHASLLPKYRGASPIQRPIINGDKITGITTMLMDEGMDTGDIILQKEIKIEDDDTFEKLHDKLAVLGGQVLVDTLKAIESGTINRVKQDESYATYTSLIKKEEGLIDWAKSAVDIKNLIRGMNPWPGAFSYYNGTMVKFWEVELAEQNGKYMPGEIIESSQKNGLVIAAGEGAVRVNEIQAENSRRMKISDYLAGHSFKIKEKLGNN